MLARARDGANLAPLERDRRRNTRSMMAGNFELPSRQILCPKEKREGESRCYVGIRYGTDYDTNLEMPSLF